MKKLISICLLLLSIPAYSAECNTMQVFNNYFRMMSYDITFVGHEVDFQYTSIWTKKVTGEWIAIRGNEWKVCVVGRGVKYKGLL